jgi:hypothetical protein
MNRTFSSLFKRFHNPVQLPLGRWQLDYCSKKLDYKVNLTNEDHCGTCSSYRLTKVTDTTVTPVVSVPVNVSSDEMYEKDENLIYLCL